METDRIRLIPPSMDIVPEVTDAVRESAKELTEYLGWVESSLSDPERNMREAIDNHDAFEKEIRHFIVEKAGATIVGAIGLLIGDRKVPSFEIGYWARTAYAGRGFVTEGVGVLEAHAFRRLGANRIEIRAAAGNRRSRAVAERSGYRLEAVLANERRLPSGELTDTVIYAKTKLDRV